MGFGKREGTLLKVADLLQAQLVKTYLLKPILTVTVRRAQHPKKGFTRIRSCGHAPVGGKVLQTLVANQLQYYLYIL